MLLKSYVYILLSPPVALTIPCPATFCVIIIIVITMIMVTTAYSVHTGTAHPLHYLQNPDDPAIGAAARVQHARCADRGALSGWRVASRRWIGELTRLGGSWGKWNVLWCGTFLPWSITKPCFLLALSFVVFFARYLS